MTYPVRTQARALLIHEAQIALVQIRRRGRERWVLPGGGQDRGEALPETVRRECREELGIDVNVGPLCIVREFVPDNHDMSAMPFHVQCIDFIFRCTPAGATELHLGLNPDDEAIAAHWVPLAAALTLPLYPAALCVWVPQVLHGTSVHYIGDAA